MCTPFCTQELHSRFEPLLLFFIDGAQIIEKGDPKWDVLMLIQPTPKGNQLVGGALFKAQAVLSTFHT